MYCLSLVPHVEAEDLEAIEGERYDSKTNVEDNRMAQVYTVRPGTGSAACRGKQVRAQQPLE